MKADSLLCPKNILTIYPFSYNMMQGSVGVYEGFTNHVYSI